MTLSTPHISFLYSSSTLVDAGMWILQKVKKSESLQQLTMADKSNLNETFIYKLSQLKELGHFKNVVLFGAEQDTYCPYDSATIQISNKVAKEKGEKTKIYQEMVTQILGSMKWNKLYRVNITFKNLSSGLDTFIGRSAHIQYLESDVLVKMLINRYESFFN